MNKQREKPGVTAEQLGAMLGRDSKGIRCGGGMIENFRRGWAMHIMPVNQKGHFFTRMEGNLAYAKSVCGLYRTVRWLYGVGDFDYCRNCKRLMKLKRISPA